MCPRQQEWRSFCSFLIIVMVLPTRRNDRWPAHSFRNRVAERGSGPHSCNILLSRAIFHFGVFSMRAVDIIRTKRDGGALTPEEINAFVEGATDGSWHDYQLSALLMAICLRGMSPEETAALCHSMAFSGMRYNWSDIPGPKVDKHSTGGVGDKTSLILAPLAAVCGAIVPMMSGRGLGHSGGTLDKLESIPGFRVDLSEAELREALRTVGV